jgi:hypothetical protein
MAVKQSLALLLLLSAVQVRAEAATIPPINAQAGFAVSMDGGWLAVGSPRDDQNGKDAGAVLLYQRHAPCWVFRQKLLAGDAQPEALFGSAVSLRGGALAVGAVGAEAVYVFDNVDGWLQTARVTASQDSPRRRFGQSVAIDGEWLAVGDMDPHGREPGVVHLFKGPAWNETALLAPASPRERERFGQAVSLRGDLLAVGAPGSAQTAGTLYVFRGQNGGWAQQAVLTAVDGVAGDQLGYSVAVNGEKDEAVAGAPTAGEGNEGAAYVFSAENEAWRQVQKLPGRSAGDQAGLSVAIDEQWLVVGAPIPFGHRTGVILFYERSPTGWLPHPQQPVLSAPHGSAYDLHGFSVALEGELAAGGAPLADPLANASGAFYSLVCDDDVPALTYGRNP